MKFWMLKSWMLITIKEQWGNDMETGIVGTIYKTNISCMNMRFWGGNKVDRFYLVVDVSNYTYFYESMEG
jgi:hypothetical protein